jgi:hypothetical protein
MTAEDFLVGVAWVTGSSNVSKSLPTGEATYSENRCNSTPIFNMERNQNLHERNALKMKISQLITR